MLNRRNNMEIIGIVLAFVVVGVVGCFIGSAFPGFVLLSLPTFVVYKTL